MDFPTCPKCGKQMLPFSDYSNNGAQLTYKSWFCVDENCGYGIVIKNGDINYTVKRS